MRIYRVNNSTKTGPLVFAEDEAEAVQIAITAKRVRNPAKAKIVDVTNRFAHPREKTDRALASGFKGIAYYRLDSSESPAVRLAMAAMRVKLPPVPTPSGWIIDGNFIA